MSPAAPSAGVTVTTTPTVSAVTSAAVAGVRGNQRARLRGPLSSPGRALLAAADEPGLPRRSQPHLLPSPASLCHEFCGFRT